ASSNARSAENRFWLNGLAVVIRQLFSFSIRFLMCSLAFSHLRWAHRGGLVVAWSIKHAIRYNIGLVGGALQLAILERTNGAWISRYEDPGETEQQVDLLEQYISAFRHEQRPEVVAQKSEIDCIRPVKTTYPNRLRS